MKNKTKDVQYLVISTVKTFAKLLINEAHSFTVTAYSCRGTALCFMCFSCVPLYAFQDFKQLLAFLNNALMCNILKLQIFKIYMYALFESLKQ